MKNPKYPKKRKDRTVIAVDLKDGTQIVFNDEVTVSCPCGKTVSFGKVSGVGTALHQVPHCKKFEEMDVIEYMRWVRKNTFDSASIKIKTEKAD